MKKEKIYSAKTKEEAVELARKDLGHDEFEDVVTLSEPSRGFFGLGARLGEFKIIYSTDPAGYAKELLEGLFERMEISDYTVDVSMEDEKTVAIQVNGEGADVLLKGRSEGAEALQLLLSVAVSRECEEYFKISFNVNDYKERTKERLERLAVKTATQVVRQRRRITLPPMTSFQRRIIHAKLADFKDVTTQSVGEDPSRRVVVSYTGPEGPAPVRSKRPDRPDRRNGDRPDRRPAGERSDRPDRGERRPGGPGRSGKPGYDKNRSDRRPDRRPPRVEEDEPGKPYTGEITRLPGEKLSGSGAKSSPVSGGTPFNME